MSNVSISVKANIRVYSSSMFSSFFTNVSVHLWTNILLKYESKGLFSPAVGEDFQNVFRFLSAVRTSLGVGYKNEAPHPKYLFLSFLFSASCLVLIKNSFISEAFARGRKRSQTGNMTRRRGTNTTLKLCCHSLSVHTISHSFHAAIWPWLCLIAFWQCEAYYRWATCRCTFYCWFHPSVQGDRKKGRKRVVSYTVKAVE